MNTVLKYESYVMACSVAERMHFNKTRCKLYRNAGESVWCVEFN